MPFVTRARETCFTWDEGSPLFGLEVTMSLRISLADMVRMGQAWQSGDPDEMADAAEQVGKYLIAWNLEEPAEDGSVPVPPTLEGWMSVDAMIKVLVFGRWMEAINASVGTLVPDPLSVPSRNGRRSAAHAGTTGAS
jgi:hypothetical protein